MTCRPARRRALFRRHGPRPAGPLDRRPERRPEPTPFPPQPAMQARLRTTGSRQKRADSPSFVQLRGFSCNRISLKYIRNLGNISIRKVDFA